MNSIIHYIRLGLLELCWNLLPHWLWFNSYIRICSYVKICSDFSIKDGKIIHTVCQTVTQCCCCASVQFVMQPLALKLIHNTTSPVTPVVVSVFVDSENGNEATVRECLTACLQHSFLKKCLLFVCVQRKSWCVQTPSRAHSLLKRQRWLTPTKGVFLMICLDVQLELTLQSDMDHWVYTALSELTSEDLSPLFASRSPSVSLKSNQKELYWHEWNQEKCCQTSFPWTI